MVRIPTLEGWVVFVQRQYIDELARAPIDSLSVLDGTIDVCRPQSIFEVSYANITALFS